jgi:hypothetical protein
LGSLAVGRLAATAAQGDVVFGGYGSLTRQLRIVTQSSADFSRDLFRMDGSWLDSTDATRTSRVTHHVYSGATKVEYLRAEGDGAGGVKIGILGATAITRPTVTGSRGGNAALASLLTALASLGLITDSTTA